MSFAIKNRHIGIKHVYGAERITIRDSNDSRYEIEKVDKLDKHSNRLLFAYL